MLDAKLELLKDLISPRFDRDVVLGILHKATNSTAAEICDIEFDDIDHQSKGDHYLSEVIRFRLIGNESGNKITLPVIVKRLPKNAARRKAFRSDDFFRNEAVFYNEVWPAFEKFQNSKDLNKKFDNIPTCYVAYSDGENDFIAMEDVSPQGFGSIERQREMVYDEAIVVMKMFGRFHALSVAFRDQQPDEFERIANKLEETYFAEKYRDWYKEFLENLKRNFRLAIHDQLPTKYIDIYDKLMAESDFYGITCKAAGRKGRFPVVSHGDAWAPNFLIKFNATNSSIEDIRLIDFQLTKYSSITVDLAFFIYCCTSEKLREEHWDDLFLSYYEAFSSFLIDLGSSPSLLTFEDLKDDFKISAIYGFCLSVEVMPFTLAQNDEAPDLNATDENADVQMHELMIPHPITSPKGKQRAASILKHIIDNNFLDYWFKL